MLTTFNNDGWLAAKGRTVDLPIETCSCPLCDSDAAQPTPYGEGRFRVVRCGDCGFWYLSPRLAAAAMTDRYVRGNYFEGGGDGYASYDAQEESLRRTFHRLLDRLEAMGLTGGDVLEVGCGYGYFLDAAAGYFDSRHGTEMSTAAARRASEHGVPVFSGSIDAVPDDLRVDAVMAFHVIEHIYDPRTFVNRMRQHLRPGGTVVLAAPDMASFWRHLMGRRWPSFKIPEHIAFYDRRTLTALMRGAGLTDLRPVPYLHDFPLGEIAAKLGLSLPQAVARPAIPLPATTVCLAGRLPAATERAAA